MGLRLKLAGAGTAVAAMVGLLTFAAPADAAGGGCFPRTGGGFAIGVCSSDNGITVFGDIYIDKLGFTGSSCYVTYQIRDWTTSSWVGNSSGRQACGLGHYPNVAAGKVAGHMYQNRARVYVNGTKVFEGDSYYTT